MWSRWLETLRRLWRALEKTDRCTEILHWLDERAAATGLAYPRAVACRAQGILATDADQAQRLFAESLAALDKVGPIPFEQARTLLCSGEAMRRNRRPVAAREPLQRPSRFSRVSARDHGRLAPGPNWQPPA